MPGLPREREHPVGEKGPERLAAGPARRPRHHLAHRRLVSRGTTASASRSLYKSDFKKRG